MLSIKAYIAKLKRHPLAVLCVFVAALLAGLAGVLDNAEKLIDRFAGPEVVTFALSKNAVGFHEMPSQDWSVDLKTLKLKNPESSRQYRTFASASDRGPAPNLVLFFTVSNPSKRDLIITHVIYDVHGVGMVAGIGPGPLASLATYHHEVKYEATKQRQDLMPPFGIPAQSAASFEIQLTARMDDPSDKTWLLRIGFIGDRGTAYTDVFQLIMRGDGRSDPGGKPRKIEEGEAKDKTAPRIDVIALDKIDDRSVRANPPSPEVQECLFMKAGIADRTAKLDEHDREALFISAATLPVEEFRKSTTKSAPPVSYEALLSPAGSLAFLRLVKAQAPCP